MNTQREKHKGNLEVCRDLENEGDGTSKLLENRNKKANRKGENAEYKAN